MRRIPIPENKHILGEMKKRSLRKKIIFVAVLTAIIGSIFSYSKFFTEAETLKHLRVETFTSSGTFTVPSGVTSVTFEGWAGGGGGSTNAGAGGGGAYMSATVSVSAGQEYTVTVGSGGAAGGNNGASTTVERSGTTYLDAQGGRGGGANGGAGGLASAGIGDFGFNGGDGNQGTSGKAGGGGGGTEGAGSSGPGGAGDFFGGAGSGGAGARNHRYYGAGGGSNTSVQRAGLDGAVHVTYQIDGPSGYATIKARNWGRSGGNTTSHVIRLPAGVKTGQLLIVVFSIQGNNPTLSGYDTNDWNLLAEQVNSGTNTVKGAIFYKIADGGSADDLTITSSASEESTHISFAIDRGGTPTASSASGDGTNTAPPSHNAGSAKKYLWIVTSSRDLSVTGDHRVSAPPTDYTDFLYLSPSSFNTGVDTAVATRHREIQTEAPGTFTSSSEQWAAFTIAVPYIDPGDPSSSNNTVKTLIKGGTTIKGGVIFKFFWPFLPILH